MGSKKETEMERVFCVTIHYHGNTCAELDVIAQDDVKARAIALDEDARSYRGHHLDMPNVEYCEVSLVCEAIAG